MKEMNGLSLFHLSEEVYLVGLSPELQEDLGDIEYMNVHPEGPIEVDDILVNLEASKAAIEIPTSISGEIIEVNEAALNDYSLLNSLDEKVNWLLKIKVN